MIRLAEMTDLEHILQITRDTIAEIYSHYYADGVVDFFLKHHSRENVLADILKGIVWLLEIDGRVVGTVTIKENAVNRLFVLSDFQSHGYGSQLMDFAEAKIAEKFSCVHVDSSLAAKEMYLKRGYREKKTCRIQADNGDILIYDEMEKRIADAQGKINYDSQITDMDYQIREIGKSEYPILSDFLYEAIFIPEGMDTPPKTIIEQPELQVYIADFGKADDWCFVAETKEKIVGAVWVRIMNDYGHIDDETPSFAISLYEEYRHFGIGAALMRTMLQFLKDKGYKQASLSVQKANYAVNMYRKTGFEVVDENEEEYIMVCRL